LAFITTDDGMDLHYEVTGEGPPIIFVHGFSMDHSVWEKQVEELTDAHQVITVDLRGHGISDKKPSQEYNIERFADDIHCFVENLDLKGCIYVGWSLGAAIGIRYAAKHSKGISKIVLIGGTPCWGRKSDFPYGHSSAQVKEWHNEMTSNRAAWYRTMINDIFYKEADRSLKKRLWRISMKLPLSIALEIVEDSAEKDLRPDLPKISQMTAIFHGTHDKFDYLEAGKLMAKTIPSAKLVEFRESGHAPFLEEPERFQSELKSFLQE